MIRCAQCGCENPLGHIFCMKCRSKLDVRALDSDAWKGPKSKPSGGRGWRLVLMLVLAGIAVCVALALWPAPLESRKGNAADAMQARKKIMLLEKGLSPASQIFNEREINACLGLLLNNVRPNQTQGVWTMLIQSVEVAIHPNAVTFATESVWGPVTFGSLKIGPWPVTHQLTVVPVHSPRKLAPHSAWFEWVIKGGRIGHLPLPGSSSAPLTAVLRPLMAASVRERNLLAAINQLELEEGQITVAVNKKSGKNQ